MASWQTRRPPPSGPTTRSTVVRHDFTAQLILPGPEPVAAYVRSMSLTPDRGEQERLVAAVTSRLPADDDGLRIGTHSGCLICS